MPQGEVTQVVAAVTELLVPGQWQVIALVGLRAGLEGFRSTDARVSILATGGTKGIKLLVRPNFPSKKIILMRSLLGGKQLKEVTGKSNILKYFLVLS